MRRSDSSTAAAAYLARADLRRRWLQVVALAVLGGLAVGVSLAFLAGARRTDSAYERHLDASHASHVEINPGQYSPESDAAIRALPGVEDISMWVALTLVRVDDEGRPVPSGEDPLTFTTDRRFYDMDQPVVTSGRLPDPERPNEAAISELAADTSGLSVGDHIDYRWYHYDEETFAPTPDDRPPLRVRIVGIFIPNEDIVPEPLDRIGRAMLSPAMLEKADAIGRLDYPWYGIRLRDGYDGVAAVDRTWRRLAAEHNEGVDDYFSAVVVERPPHHRAAGPLRAGGAAARDRARHLRGPVAPRVGRLRRGGRRAAGPAAGGRPRDLPDARARSPGPRAGRAGGAPRRRGRCGRGRGRHRGPRVARVPDRAVPRDRAVPGDRCRLAGGGDRIPRRCSCWADPSPRGRSAGPRRGPSPERPRCTRRAPASWLARSGLPLPMVLGARQALEPGRGRTAVPTRSTLVALMGAVLVLVTAVVFAGNLRDLESDTSRFGWNSDAVAISGAGYDAFIPPKATPWLRENGVARLRYATTGRVVVDGSGVAAVALARGPGRPRAHRDRRAGPGRLR